MPASFTHGRERASFAFESTLASKSIAPWLAALVRRGYEFHLALLWLSGPDLALARVRRRVASGGHNVPEAVVRRRYHGGLQNLFRHYLPLAARWWIYDNSTEPTLRIVAAGGLEQTTLVRDRATWIRMRGGEPGMVREEGDGSDLLEQGLRMESALRKAVRAALRRHKKLGESIAVWRDEQVVIVPPEEIDVSDDDEKDAGS